METETELHEDEPEAIGETSDPRRESLETVAETPGKASDSERMDALEYLLGDDDDELVTTKKFDLNVGSPDQPKLISWTVRAVDGDVLRQAQRQAQGNRQQRRALRGSQDTDQGESNLRVVTLATVDPDLMEVCRRKQIADPAIVVKRRLGHKPGLIDQLAAEVLLISGYDDEDVRDSAEVKAAGN